MSRSNFNREESIMRAHKIAAVLSSAPMKAAEINTALSSDYTALQVANAVRLIPGPERARSGVWLPTAGARRWSGNIPPIF